MVHVASSRACRMLKDFNLHFVYPSLVGHSTICSWVAHLLTSSVCTLTRLSCVYHLTNHSAPFIIWKVYISVWKADSSMLTSPQLSKYQ